MRTPTWRVSALLLGSGCCALIYQIAWIREFRLIFGASTAASAYQPDAPSWCSVARYRSRPEPRQLILLENRLSPWFGKTSILVHSHH